MNTDKPQTDVASLELCKELYELNGWHGLSAMWIKYPKIIRKGSSPEHDWSYEKVAPLNYKGKYNYIAPAYPLGYLLRKLPPYVHVWRRDEGAEAECYDPENPLFRITIHADTPADAACKLAIELIKQKVITP